MRDWIKQQLEYDPLQETERVRALIARHHVNGFPICPPWEGDFLFRLSQQQTNSRALEIGFATGSTALYILAGSARRDGTLVSIDYRPRDHGNVGPSLLREAGFASRHVLMEQNSNMALPELLARGEPFGLAYVDGWKTFDHLALDVYYVSRLLIPGGFLVFDDTGMPSVRKAIALLLSHYAYREVDYGDLGETLRMRIRSVLTTRTHHRSFRGFVKLTDEARLPISSDWNFWRPF